jgi:2-dehydro-3-deoxyphosphogluconate aldolase / (4S)-4-hydroxy-2-oxoglutarate aldolase
LQNTSFFWEKFKSFPVIGIMRNIPLADTEHILPIFYDSGLTTVEITMNSPDCEKIIRSASMDFDGKLNVGAGTVCSEDDFHRAVTAGAQFIVTPFTDEKVISLSKKNNIPIFPGAFTPTEIVTAWRLGADAVKIFPVIANGPEYVRALLGPLDQIKLVPTGGVNMNNCVDFFKAGSFGLGMGSPLFAKEYIQNKNWKSLREHFELLSRLVKPYCQNND